MMLVDTSVWIEFLRTTGSPADVRLRTMLTEQQPMAVTDLIVLEVTAGAGSEFEASRLAGLLNHAQPLPTRPFLDHEAAAVLYRACRRSGFTPRSLIDCLIAAVAINHDIPVMHFDRDFDAIAAATELEVFAP